MNRDRLAQLAALLRQPLEHFNITYWHSDAIGNASRDPVFMDQGLSLQYDGFAWEPSYEGLGGWEAVQRFFDLSETDAERLFSWLEYPNQGDTTASDVADRIEELLATAEVSA